jgi:chemotaxis protein MotB
MLNKKESEEQNFWISYADLMAGLLFVFILLIGAIVVKSVLIQSDMQTIRADLEKEKKALQLSEKDLYKKKQELRALSEKFQQSREENLRLGMKISLLKSEVSDLKDNVNNLSTQIDKQNEIISLSQKELESVKDLLLDRDNQIATLKSDLETLQQKEQENRNLISLKDDEIMQLQKALLLKKRAYQEVVEDLNITKTKVKALTGIKIKVVQKLKEKLGNSIEIDPKTGSLRLSSNILFNQGQADLKPEAKKTLKKLLGKYINTLLTDSDIRKYIDLITIEGYTNSDGSYIYNLNLSQQRALAVMQFLYDEFPQNRKLFRKYLSASGRAFANPILKANGTEDKDASRRIEIKFQITNEDAAKELMNYINKRDKNE